MNHSKYLLMLLICGIIISGCEIPKKPNFTASHKVEAPVMYNKTYQFMGGSNALIDTTSGDMDSLFSVDGDNFITISKEEEFEIGDLDDAVPEVTVDPTDFESEVGEIELQNFTSEEGDLGRATFHDVTGMSPVGFGNGSHINAGNNPNPILIGIGANTDYFVSAVVKSGGLDITIKNDLGFPLDNVSVQVIDTVSNEEVGQPATFANGIAVDQTETETVIFSEGDVLANLGVKIDASWQYHEFDRAPRDLIVENVEGNNLIASQVEAAVESQDFSTHNTTEIDDEEFKFTQPDHYAVLMGGDLIINSIVNNLDVDIEYLKISFPGIRYAPYTEADSLVIEYQNGERIRRKSNSVEKNQDLTNYRIYALNNQIDYNITAYTENTQQGEGSEARIMVESDNIESSVDILNLEIEEAFGMINTKNVSLGDDDLSNGEEVLDLFYDTEAEITEIDGMADLSDQISGLEFTESTLTIHYATNVGVGTRVYGAFLGIDGSGNQVFLHGSSGSKYEVSPIAPINGLVTRGQQLAANQLVQFDLEQSDDGEVVYGAVTFTDANSNIGEFMNNLPSEIRFVGKAVINEGYKEGTIYNPVQFDPHITVDLPLAFRTSESSVFRDTSAQTFDLPSSEKDDQSVITEGILVIDYTNGLPLGIDLSIGFLDSLKSKVVTVPSSDDDIYLNAAGVDNSTKFAVDPNTGSITVALNKEQLNKLYRTKSMEIVAKLITTNNSEVKMRTSDTIKLSVRAEIKVETHVE